MGSKEHYHDPQHEDSLVVDAALPTNKASFSYYTRQAFGIEHARRELVRTIERTADFRRHQLFGNADLWEDLFVEVILAEDERDQNIQQQIRRLSDNNPQIALAEEEHYLTIEADCTWYEYWIHWIDRVLEAQHPPIDATQQQMLLWQRYRLLSRLWARRVRLAQLSLEQLERKRRIEGAVPLSIWREVWEEFVGYTEAEHAHYQLALQGDYQQTIPGLVVEAQASRERALEWIQELLYGYTTVSSPQNRHAQAHRASFDYCIRVVQIYRDALQREINPAPIGWQWLLLALIILASSVFWLWLNR